MKNIWIILSHMKLHEESHLKQTLLTHSFLLSLFYLTSYQKEYFNSPHLITIYIYFNNIFIKKIYSHANLNLYTKKICLY